MKKRNKTILNQEELDLVRKVNPKLYETIIKERENLKLYYRMKGRK